MLAMDRGPKNCRLCRSASNDAYRPVVIGLLLGDADTRLRRALRKGGDGGTFHFALDVTGTPPAPALISPLKMRGRREQLVADVLHELAVLLRLGDDGKPFRVRHERAPALLALPQVVPGEHVRELLIARADNRRPEPRLTDAVRSQIRSVRFWKRDISAGSFPGTARYMRNS